MDEDEEDSSGFIHPPARYEGEDTMPTTERELHGWYAYPVAAEVFAVVAVGKFLPARYPYNQKIPMFKNKNWCRY